MRVEDINIGQQFICANRVYLKIDMNMSSMLMDT